MPKMLKWLVSCKKYDLEAIPVVDAMGRLVGRITIDDIIDVIRDEADKDYQLAAVSPRMLKQMIVF
jgi:Mg/Co/Ni transporter MgtE